MKSSNRLASRQTTLGGTVRLQGIGVHSGKPAAVVLSPGRADGGILFLRTGLPGGRTRAIEANISEVTATELCTVIGDTAQGSVSTVEHLLAAVAGLGIDNLRIEVDGPEAPILDGSSAPFVDAIDRVGVVAQAAPRRYLKVLKTVRAESRSGFAELRPHAAGFRVEVEIDFDNPVIGRQARSFDVTPETFRREIANARTFGMMGDVERLWKAGFALGASLDNTVAVGDDRVINPEGLRFADEFVRHKALDAVGDLSLAGLPILGAYRAYRGGHRLNAGVLQALFADETAYAVVEAGLREVGTRVAAGPIAVPAYAPDAS